MIPDGIAERFELYRKWFKTFLVKEFLNLPLKYQERFLIMTDNFSKDCRRILDENKSVQEKMIQLVVEKVRSSSNALVIYGHADNVKEEIKIDFPINRSKPKIGSKLYITVYSITGDVWYSSKEELITKTKGTL